MSDISQSGRLNDVADIRRLVPEPPSMMHRRLQPGIDDHCMTVIGHASVCVVGFADQAGIVFVNLRATPLLRAEAEFIDLVWPAGAALPPALQRGDLLNCSLYFIMPGIGFTLRANGRCSATENEDGRTRLAFVADALFLHCSRAKVRANFWEPRAFSSEVDTGSPATNAKRLRGENASKQNGQAEAPPGGPAGTGALSDQALAFVAQSPYLLMLTQNAAGKTELSPRGDPDGFVRVLDRSTLLIPERPGNKVACTLINIVSHEWVTVAFLIPGSTNVLSVTGRCWLSSDRTLLEPVAVQGKVPKIGMVLHVDEYCIRHCPALVEAGLWLKQTHLREGDIPSFAKMLAEHMNGRGFKGKATALLVDAVVKHDLKNLY